MKWGNALIAWITYYAWHAYDAWDAGKFIEYLNVDQRALLLEEKKFFVVKNITADYQLPAYFGDNLVICTTLVELKKASMVLKQEILREGKKVFDSSVRLALLNSSERPEKFSVDMVLEIKNFFKLK